MGHVTISLPVDVKQISWAAFKVGAQWRISVPRFLAEVHGEPTATDRP